MYNEYTIRGGEREKNLHMIFCSLCNVNIETSRQIFGVGVTVSVDNLQLDNWLCMFQNDCWKQSKLVSIERWCLL